jgi:APA family basic amino acid/polyamine antiporter
MARRGELPGWFAAIDERRSLPIRAEASIAVIVIVLTAVFDLRGAIGFSGVTILTYYAITNAACLSLPATRRHWPPWIAVAGLVGCITLAVMLPLVSVAVGLAVLLTGLAVLRSLRRRVGRGVESVVRPDR